MSFVPGNRLEDAMMRAASDTAARTEFYRLLLDSELFVIGNIKGDDPDKPELALAEAEGLSIETIAYEGKTYHPLFTSQERLRGFLRAAMPYFSMQGRALFECTRGASFLLNPGSEVSKILAPDEIGYVLEHVKPNAAVNIVLSTPKAYPKKLVQALCVLFVSRSQVISAHLAYVSRDGDGGEPHPLIAILADGDIQILIQEIFATAALAMPGVVIDVIGIDPDAQLDSFRRQLVDIAPFYRRMPPSNFN
jgi:hypothetical protein